MVDHEDHVFYGGPLINSIHCKCSSLGALAIKRLKENGDHVAFIDPVTERSVTYSEILDRSLRIAHRLRHYGVSKRSIVAIVSENRVEFPIVVLSVIYLNATMILLNPGYTTIEFDHVLNLTKPSVVFASAKPLQTLLPLKSSIETFVSLDAIPNLPPNVIPISEFLTHENNSLIAPDPVILLNDVAVMVLSSGTTGLPKAVQLTHHNVMTVMAYMREDPRYTQLSVPIRLLGVLPFYHVYGLMLSLNVCCNRYPMVVLSRFEPELFLACIQKYRITMLNLVPAMMIFLAKHPSVTQYDLTSLKALLCGAAPLSGDIERQVLARLPYVGTIRTGYGMSESSLGVISNCSGKPGSVGQVQKATWVKVVDVATRETLGPNQVGEICIKGPLVMKGYYGDAAATQQTIDANGWLHSGDTGYFDGQRDFFIVDRIKDLIKYKGFQVAPAEVEAVLLSHPKVADAAVVGVPDEECGELPAAFVVRQAGVELGGGEVVEFVASKLSREKHIRGGVYFVEQIPKTGSGKILRRELRKLVGAGKAKL